LSCHYGKTLFWMVRVVVGHLGTVRLAESAAGAGWRGLAPGRGPGGKRGAREGKTAKAEL